MLGFFQTGTSVSTPDIEMGIEMGIEREQPNGNITEPSDRPVLPQNNKETGAASEIIERQKETIDMCMVQVSHRWHFDEDVT
jgi:hypothetical protein